MPAASATAIPAIGFGRERGGTTRVVSLMIEPLAELLDWLEVVDLLPKPGTGDPLDVEIPGAVLGERGAWVAVCAQVRSIPRSRLQAGTLGVLPEPHLSRVRDAVRVLLDL
jgi:hypothetical protein